MRLIDADGLKENIQTLYENMSTLVDEVELHELRRLKWKIMQTIEDAPTVDAEPVRHGAWERVEVIYPEENKNAVPGAIASMFCPVCKRWHSEVYFYGNPIERVNYCNHCGAKMDVAKAINAPSKKEEDDG